MHLVAKTCQSWKRTSGINVPNMVPAATRTIANNSFIRYLMDSQYRRRGDRNKFLHRRHIHSSSDQFPFVDGRGKRAGELVMQALIPGMIRCYQELVYPYL
jgi:hypothetical protein